MSGSGADADRDGQAPDVLDRDLPSGITCRFKLRPETRTLDGRSLTGKSAFA